MSAASAAVTAAPLSSSAQAPRQSTQFAEDPADSEEVQRLLSHLARVGPMGVMSSACAENSARSKAAAAMASSSSSGGYTSDNIPLYALPDEEYLEATTLPLLLRALEEVAKVRPPDPLAFIAAYLLGNNPQRTPTGPLLHNAEGRKVPLIELAERAATHWSVDGCERAHGEAHGEAETDVWPLPDSAAPL